MIGKAKEKQKKLLILLIQIFFINYLFFEFPYTCSADKIPYGIFIGYCENDLDKFLNYNEIIIDASYFSKKQIDYLHQNNIKVYSYLNIGSIEKFRTYYNNFENITLGDYHNWPDEKWVDISNADWQNYIIKKLAKDLVNKNIDGFFIDNVDIYGEFRKEEIFKGILNILENLNIKYEKPIIINGGYEFINSAFLKNINMKDLIYGVNQEEVVTKIVNYSKNKFKKQTKNEINFVISYLDMLERKGLNIYITEYSKSSKLNRQIKKYYDNKHFKVYISNSINLN